MNTSLLHYAFNMRGMDYCGCEYKGNTIHIKRLTSKNLCLAKDKAETVQEELDVHDTA